MTWAQTHTPLPETVPWARENLWEEGGTSYAMHTVREVKHREGMALSRVTRCKFMFAFYSKRNKIFFVCCLSHKAGIFTCKSDLPEVRTSGNLAELVRTWKIGWIETHC